MTTESQPITDFKNISFFKGLNALRFLAAFLVVMHHSEAIRLKNGIGNFEWLSLFRNGGNAVVFFFVLSGFLITYLLLKELNKTNTVSVKRFYLKRILRIWPLYFLLVFIGVIALPFVFKVLGIGYEMPYTLGETWYYFVFFLPGLVTFYFGHHLLEPLWSIGVEEVFYLIWAPLFKVNQKRILRLLISVIAIKIVLNLLGMWVFHNEFYSYLMEIFKIEAMAVGGLGAYFIFTKGQELTQSVIFKPAFQVAIFSVLVTFLAVNSNVHLFLWDTIFKTPIISAILVDLLFLYTIICISSVSHSVVHMNNRFISYLGEISYGIYMYHMLAIFMVILVLKERLGTMGIVSNTAIFYLSVTTLTIVMASLSKYFFEDYFLSLKKRLDKK